MTDVCLIIDESGSMASKKAETIVAVNEYFRQVRENNSVENVHLVLFNSDHVTAVHDGVPLPAVPEFGKGTYRPRGMTPLYDAMGRTLESMIGGRMFVVVVTDGQENTSREYSRESIANLISEREARGWDFIFLGADFDAWGNASGLGVSRGKTVSFSGAQMTQGLTAAATATAAYNDSGERLPDDYFQQNPMTDDDFRGWVDDDAQDSD